MSNIRYVVRYFVLKNPNTPKIMHRVRVRMPVDEVNGETGKPAVLVESTYLPETDRINLMIAAIKEAAKLNWHYELHKDDKPV